MIKRSLQLMICAAMVVGGLPSALARPTRIAMTKVSGDASGVGRAVAEAIDDGSLVIVPAPRVARALERLKLDDQQLSDGDIGRLADELEVDAVIRGAYDRKTRKMRFTIFAGGKKAKPFAVVVRNPQSTKFRTLIHDTVMTRLATLVSESSKRKLSAPSKDEPAPQTKLMADPPDSAPAPAPAKLMADPPDSGLRKLGSEPAEPAVTEAALDHSGPRSANLAVGRADLGVSVMARNFQYDATTTSNGPPRYRNGPVPGARFEGEVYPFALNDASSSLAGLGIAADLDQTIALSVPDAAGNRLKTTERHYAIGLRYRLAFGDAPTRTTLTLGAGYAARQFAVDRASSMSTLDLPDVGYQLVDPGAALRLPLGPRLAVTLAGRGLIALSAGAIQRADQYGGTQLYGATASAGLEILFGDTIALRIAGEATELLLKFSGNGALANRDSDASTIEVRGATDRYLGGAATLAIVY
jgi:hypothetical protein